MLSGGAAQAGSAGAQGHFSGAGGVFPGLVSHRHGDAGIGVQRNGMLFKKKYMNTYLRINKWKGIFDVVRWR